MKVAIAQTKFTHLINVWINYCENYGIEYLLVNPYDNDIIHLVKDCDAFLWHHSQNDYRDLIFAKQLLFSLQQAGIAVYPDFNSGWHFDDKLGQKYLLEAVGAPLVKSYAFFTKEEALGWAESTAYPKVFKLRCGAASVNVKLIHSFKEAKSVIKKAFGRGFPPYNAQNNLQETFYKFKCGKSTFKNLMGSLCRMFSAPSSFKHIKTERGYVYFQDFMPNNTYDTRVIVVNGKYACAERRMTRKGDFRASGSGNFSFENIDENIIKIAFETSKKLKMQSVAYDFVYDENHNPRIVEICFGFGTKGISQSPGYWTDDMVWHGTSDTVPFHEWIIEGVIQSAVTNTNAK